MTTKMGGDLIALWIIQAPIGHGCSLASAKPTKQIGLTEAREIGWNIAIHGPEKEIRITLNHFYNGLPYSL